MNKRLFRFVLTSVLLVLSLSCTLGFRAQDAALAAEVMPEKVYVSGAPIGLSFKNVGLVIVGRNDVLTDKGLVNTIEGSNLKNGDVIVKAAGKPVNTAEELSEIINSEENAGKTVQIEVKRQGKTLTADINPALDVVSKKYKAGLWVREDTLGIGTLTYVTEKTGKFGALGHAVADADTRQPLDLLSGKVFECTITGVTKGTRGKTGELKGVFVGSSAAIGTVTKNELLGVYGNMNERPESPIYAKPLSVLKKGSVRPGKATILSTVSGSVPEEYTIEIIKVNYQNKPSDKCIVIKITDERLLEATGGIVQGMSGSPIIQDGKLCGAVTHVFVNDPSRGYAVFAEWMLSNNK